jgi:GR25 family glycosyltransferase involved in LPS biosynthesis
MNLNNYFDHIYCLNLPECKERAADTQKRCDDFGISFSFFPAISGKLFSDIHSGYSGARSTRVSNPNYMACALGHLSIYRHALSNSYDRILVIEDDLLFNRNMDSILVSAKDEIPDQWDLLYLAFIPLTDDLMFWNYGIIDDRFIGDKVFRAKNLWSAMAYGISADTMRWMVDRFNGSFDKELDRVFVEEVQPRGNSFAVCPQIFAGYDNMSNNSERFDTIFVKSFDSRRARPEDYV